MINASRGKQLCRRTAPWAILGAFFLTACPDTTESFDRFMENSQDLRGSGGDVGLPDIPTGGVLSDGTYFMAVNTTILPGSLLWLAVEVTTAGEGDTLTADFELQPLTTDEDGRGDPRDEPRTPVGDAILIEDVPIEDGRFTVEAGEITIHGDANPITTGVQITADLTLIGVVADDMTLCGNINGDVLFPIENNIDGSTFGASLFEGDDFTTIEEPLFECPEAVGGGDPEPDMGADVAGET